VIRLLDARFVTTAVSAEQYPGAELPEVAFVGRSNVGKSSMINALTGRRKLVRVSKTPGRTRTINFFDVELERDQQRRKVRLADMPGYGFARVSKAELQKWEEMITTYLARRQSLRAVVSIVDAAIGPTPADHQALEYLVTAERAVLVVATKVDQIGKAKRKPRLAAIAKQLDLPEDRVILFSAVERIGVEEVWEALLDSL
jgi:GTP-binding protein